MVLIFFGSENESDPKQLVTMRLKVDNSGTKFNITSSARAIVQFRGAMHATFCYCAGALYTLVIEDNPFDI